MVTYLFSFATKVFCNNPYMYVFTNSDHPVLFHSNPLQGINKDLVTLVFCSVVTPCCSLQHSIAAPFHIDT